MIFREFNISDVVDWERKWVIGNIMLGKKGTSKEEECFAHCHNFALTGKRFGLQGDPRSVALCGLCNMYHNVIIFLV
jgi:hypothetical protein